VERGLFEGWRVGILLGDDEGASVGLLLGCFDGP